MEVQVQVGDLPAVVAPEPDPGPWTGLSARERQVADLLANGMTNREIATQLGISSKTVDTHRGHILKKLNVRSNTGLLLFALRSGWVKL